MWVFMRGCGCRSLGNALVAMCLCVSMHYVSLYLREVHVCAFLYIILIDTFLADLSQAFINKSVELVVG